MGRAPVSIKEALNSLSRMPRDLDKAKYEMVSIDPPDLFKAIVKTISEIDKPAIPQKPPRSQKYLQQWQRYIEGEIPTLDKPALKYLCWENEVVQHPEFCRYLVKNSGTLVARAIKGLASTIHNNWHKEAHSEPITYFAVAELTRFSGSDRTIAKWKSDSKLLFGKDASANFAKRVLLDSLMSIQEAAALWAISEDTGYMRYSVVNAFEQAMKNSGRDSYVTNYILNELLCWGGWNVNADGFRHMIGKLILSPDVNTFAEALRVKIVTHPMLGDPRLPKNKQKWLSIDPDATRCFISWLSKEDIKFFFDNVLEGHDPHGRRNFWLKYVNRIVASRPLLSETTAYPFINSRELNFGRLSGGQNKAAFILDFGELIAVEFSEIGMIYLYKRDEFVRYVPDIWTLNPIYESRLKNQGIPSERKIRHKAVAQIVNVDWRNDTAFVLATHGVRP